MVLLLLALLGCREDGKDPAEGAAARGDCNPVEDSHCLLPFPSDFFTEPDLLSATGRRLAFGPTSLPVNVDGVALDPTYLHEKDGFSPNSTLFAHLPGATLDGVVLHTDIGRYLDEDARTVILDAATGERIPHFVEREAAAAGTGRDLLLLRPARALEFSRTYVVGIRGLVDEGGAPAAAPDGFAALRDDDASDDADIERQRGTYEDLVFPALEGAGFAREELQLAWSFSTASEENTRGKMRWMREDALAKLGEAGPPYAITEVEEGDCAAGDTIGRTLEGTMTVPLYLTSWEPGSLLTRDEDGMPYYNGDADVPFTVRIPCSLLTSPRAGTLVQYGHGLLGGRDEVEQDYLGRMADSYGWILFAADWTGMKFEDSGPITLALIEAPHTFAMVPERTQQGFVEFMALAALMRGGMVSDPLLQAMGPKDSHPVELIDPSRLYFYGNSQGGVLGGAYVAINPDIERAVLGVPGMPFTLLLTRAVGFGPFFSLLETMYEDWADISLMIGLFQPLWDPGEAAGWASEMDTPALIQAAIGDASVPTLGAHYMAREYGAKLLTPAPRSVWGLEESEAPIIGSALVEFDYGLEEPLEAVPATDEDHNPHAGPRSSAEGQEQIRIFLETGVVEQTCDGACDPG